MHKQEWQERESAQFTDINAIYSFICESNGMYIVHCTMHTQLHILSLTFTLNRSFSCCFFFVCTLTHSILQYILPKNERTNQKYARTNKKMRVEHYICEPKEPINMSHLITNSVEKMRSEIYLKNVESMYVSQGMDKKNNTHAHKKSTLKPLPSS